MASFPKDGYPKFDKRHKYGVKMWTDTAIKKKNLEEKIRKHNATIRYKKKFGFNRKELQSKFQQDSAEESKMLFDSIRKSLKSLGRKTSKKKKKRKKKRKKKGGTKRNKTKRRRNKTKRY